MLTNFIAVIKHTFILMFTKVFLVFEGMFYSESENILLYEYATHYKIIVTEHAWCVQGRRSRGVRGVPGVLAALCPWVCVCVCVCVFE